MLRVPAAGGPVEPVTELDKSRGETAHIRPHFLPDGRHFLFLAQSTKPENNAIFAGSLESKDRKQLVASTAMAAFAPPNHLLFMRQNTLMRQEFDVNRLELRGDPSPIVEQVPIELFRGIFSVSETGILAYRRAVNSDLRQLPIVDRTGQQVSQVGSPAIYQNPALSPDQQLVAVNRAEQGGDIWILDIARGTASRFTFDPGTDDNPLWSPDGTRIAFSSTRDGGVANLYQKQSGGAGQEQLVLKTDKPKIPADWSRDGRYIIYEEQDSKGGSDLWILPMSGANASPAGRSDQRTSGDKKPTPFLQTPFNERRARFSPDGRWIAYSSNESGRAEVYVQSFPPTGSKWQISTDGGIQPQWRNDGKELFYISPTANDQFMTVDILTKPVDAVFKAGVPKKMFVIDVVTGPLPLSQRNSYEIMKDGQRLLVNPLTTITAPNNRSSITLILNWPATLKN